MIGNRKDPLVDAVKKIMDHNENERRVIAEFNDELGIHNPKSLPREQRAAYDQALAKRLNEKVEPEQYSDKQKKMAALAGNPKKIDAADLAVARKGGAAHIEEAKKKSVMVVLKNPKTPKGKQAKEGGGGVFRLPAHLYDPKKHDLVSEEQVDEATYSAKAARAGEDIGKPGKEFAKIAKEAGARYGSKESGKKVAGAVLAKIRAKKMEEETEQLLASIQEEIRNSLLEKANWLNENGTQEQVVEFLNNLTMEERSILNIKEEEERDPVTGQPIMRASPKPSVSAANATEKPGLLSGIAKAGMTSAEAERATSVDPSGGGNTLNPSFRREVPKPAAPAAAPAPAATAAPTNVVPKPAAPAPRPAPRPAPKPMSSNSPGDAGVEDEMATRRRIQMPGGKTRPSFQGELDAADNARSVPAGTNTAKAALQAISPTEREQQFNNARSQAKRTQNDQSRMGISPSQAIMSRTLKKPEKPMPSFTAPNGSMYMPENTAPQKTLEKFLREDFKK